MDSFLSSEDQQNIPVIDVDAARSRTFSTDREMRLRAHLRLPNLLVKVHQIDD